MAFTKVPNADYRIVSGDKALNISGALLLPARVTETEVKGIIESYVTQPDVSVG